MGYCEDPRRSFVGPNPFTTSQKDSFKSHINSKFDGVRRKSKRPVNGRNNIQHKSKHNDAVYSTPKKSKEVFDGRRMSKVVPSTESKIRRTTSTMKNSERDYCKRSEKPMDFSPNKKQRILQPVHKASSRNRSDMKTVNSRNKVLQRANSEMKNRKLNFGYQKGSRNNGLSKSRVSKDRETTNESSTRKNNKINSAKTKAASKGDSRPKKSHPSKHKDDSNREESKERERASKGSHSKYDTGSRQRLAVIEVSEIKYEDRDLLMNYIRVHDKALAERNPKDNRVKNNYRYIQIFGQSFINYLRSCNVEDYECDCDEKSNDLCEIHSYAGGYDPNSIPDSLAESAATGLFEEQTCYVYIEKMRKISYSQLTKCLHPDKCKLKDYISSKIATPKLIEQIMQKLKIEYQGLSFKVKELPVRLRLNKSNRIQIITIESKDLKLQKIVSQELANITKIETVNIPLDEGVSQLIKRIEDLPCNNDLDLDDMENIEIKKNAIVLKVFNFKRQDIEKMIHKCTNSLNCERVDLEKELKVKSEDQINILTAIVQLNQKIPIHIFK